MANKRLGKASISVVPELKTDKAQKQLDELTKPKEVEITPKINTQKVFGEMQAILDRQSKSLKDALDFKGLANQMQDYIKGISKTADKSLSASLQATLDDFSGRFENLSYQADNGKLIKGYKTAAIEAEKALGVQKKINSEIDKANKKLRESYLATRKVYEVKGSSGLQIFPTKAKADSLVANVRGLGGTISDPVEKYLSQVNEELRDSLERIYYTPSAIYSPGKTFELQDGDLETYVAMIKGIQDFTTQYNRLNKLLSSGAKFARIRPNQNMLDQFDWMLNDPDSILNVNETDLLERILSKRVSSHERLESMLEMGKETSSSEWRPMAAHYYDGKIPKLVDNIKEAAKARKEEAKAIEQAVVAQEKLNDAVQQGKNLGYHAGDLGKAESYGEMYGGKRDTGHFGTGTYFVGNPDKIKGYNSRDGIAAPVEIVDFTKYNLFKPSDTEQAWELHHALQQINYDLIKMHKYDDVNLDVLQGAIDNNDSAYIANFINRYLDEYTLSKYKKEALEYKSYLEGLDESKIRDEVQKNFRDIGSFDRDGNISDDVLIYDDIVEDLVRERLEETKSALESFNLNSEVIKRVAYDLDSGNLENVSETKALKDALAGRLSKIFVSKTKEEISDVLECTFSTISKYNEASFYELDNASTVFMKKLGYEGIDTRHTALDNTGYGSVIYDLKEEDLARRQEILRIQQQAKSNQQLTSSYEGLAEAVTKFHAVNQKVFAAYKNNSQDYKQLVQERDAAIADIQKLFPEGQASEIADRLKHSALRDATGQDLIGFVESNLKKAISADAFVQFSKLVGKYSSGDADMLFGSLPTINEGNIKEIYDQLIAKEKEYLESGAKSVSAFKERNLFLEQSVELTDKLKDNEQFMQQRGNLLGMVTDGIHTSAEAMKLLDEFIVAIPVTPVVEPGAVQTEVTENTNNQPVQIPVTPVIEDEQKIQKEIIDENLKKFTRGIDVKSLFSGVTSSDMPEIKSEFYKIVELMQRYERAKQNGIDTSDIMNDINEMTVNIIDMITDSVYSVTKKGEYIYQDFWEEMRGQHLQYSPEEYKKEFGDDFADMIRGMTSGKHQKLFTKEQSPHAETADTLYQRLAEKFGSIMLTRDDRKPNENNIYELFDAIVTTWRKAIDERSLGAIREPVLTAPKDEFQADLYTKFAMATAQIASNIEKAVSTENELANAAERAAKAKQKQLEITKKASSEISAEEIVARNMNEALEKLSSAKNNQTTLFNLKGVSDGDSLIEQAQAMVKNIAEQANLSLANFNVKDDTIKVKLYNDELKVTVDQMYRLKSAAEDAESATLELISESFNQNVKKLNEDTFDLDGLKDRAAASVAKVRSSLHGLEYDLTSLSDAASNISSEDDFKKFQNQLKATQDNIQAIKNATVSKSSMNQLANMQRDMKNANTELDTMRIKLQKIGDIDGVKKAHGMISEMENAVNAFNKAQDAEKQQEAYSKYSDARSSFKVQLEYLNAKKSLGGVQPTPGEDIKKTYQEILDLTNKINSIDTEIIGLRGKNKTGIYNGIINQLQAEKATLIGQVQTVAQEVGDKFSSAIQGDTERSIDGARFFTTEDTSNINTFFNAAQVQSALTTEEINKLSEAFAKSRTIGIDAGSKFAESLTKVSELYQNLNSNNVKYNKDSKEYQNAIVAYSQYHSKIDALKGKGSTDWSAEEYNEIQRLTEQFLHYGSVLEEVTKKEQRYFSGKTKYTKDLTVNDMVKNAAEDVQDFAAARQKLEKSAKAFAEDSGFGEAFITKFTQGADGISKLDFSVLDKATGQLRNFSMEMGSVTDGMFVTESTINKSLANIKAANKQVEKSQQLISSLGQYNVGGDTAQIQRLLQLTRDLQAELNKGDAADQSEISRLTRECKLASAEVEKLYKKHVMLQNAIEDGNATKLTDVNLGGDIYKQLTNSVNEYVSAHEGANAKIGKFNTTTGQLKFSMEAADGTVKEFTVSLDRLGKQAVIQQSGVRELGSRWDQFKNSLSRTGRQLATALLGANVFYKAISEIRKGYGYVKEIDLAMTELKKVTDETALSYKNFLDTASKTASAIGSTVSDFTEATANFARLGYTMDESAKMAETAIVYKNVADGLDTVEQSTESIISTMKAFGIESDDTMSIIDRFNEVGKNIAQVI